MIRPVLLGRCRGWLRRRERTADASGMLPLDPPALPVWPPWTPADLGDLARSLEALEDALLAGAPEFRLSGTGEP